LLIVATEVANELNNEEASMIETRP